MLNRLRAYTIGLLVTLAFGCATVYGQGQQRLRFLDIRALGMGGAGITTLNDISALAYNPAMLSRSSTRLEILNLHINASRDAADLYDYVDENEEVLDNFTDTTFEVQERVLNEIAQFDNNWMGVGAFPGFGFTSRGLGIGTYGVANLGTRLDKGIFEPRIAVDGQAEWIFTGGLALKVPKSVHQSFLANDLYAGAALRIIRRWETQIDYAASEFDIDNAYDTLVESENRVNGWGIDLGLLYEAIPGVFDIGARIVDLYGEIDGETRGMIVNVGGSYKITRRLRAAADFNDLFFHNGDNAFTHLYFGAEFKPLSIIAFRGGFGQGYPSAGVGLDFKYLQLDAAYFGVEQSSAPGGDGDYSYAVRIRFGT